MSETLVLIGPMFAGKSTQAALLSEKLGVSRVSMDDVRWDYYAEIGWSQEQQDAIRQEGGFQSVYHYWKPFEAYAVERILADHPGKVIDFGAGHSVYDDAALFERVERVLAPIENVILLLPSPDPDESIRILRAREDWEGMPGFDAHEHFVRHPSNGKLAKHTVYTAGKTPEETCAEILALLEAENRQ